MNSLSKYGLSDTEYEIMEIMWKFDDKMSFRQLQAYFNDVVGKNWKKQTTTTYLSKLIKLGLLKAEKDQDNKYQLYYPIVSKTELRHNWAKKLLDEFFEGSVGNFLAAFSGGHTLEQKDAEELRDFLEDN